jgi:hypothetical protein
VDVLGQGDVTGEGEGVLGQPQRGVRRDRGSGPHRLPQGYELHLDIVEVVDKFVGKGLHHQICRHRQTGAYIPQPPPTLSRISLLQHRRRHDGPRTATASSTSGNNNGGVTFVGIIFFVLFFGFVMRDTPLGCSSPITL